MALVRKRSIRKVSLKRIKINKIYSALRKKFLEDHPYCQWCLAEHGLTEDTIKGHAMRERGSGWLLPWGMTQCFIARSEDIHHKRGRGRFLLDTTTWMAVSRFAHGLIHHDPATSYAKGYMQQR